MNEITRYKFTPERIEQMKRLLPDTEEPVQHPEVWNWTEYYLDLHQVIDDLVSLEVYTEDKSEFEDVFEEVIDGKSLRQEFNERWLAAVYSMLGCIQGVIEDGPNRDNGTDEWANRIWSNSIEEVSAAMRDIEAVLEPIRIYWEKKEQEM